MNLKPDSLKKLLNPIKIEQKNYRYGFQNFQIQSFSDSSSALTIADTSHFPEFSPSSLAEIERISFSTAGPRVFLIALATSSVNSSSVRPSFLSEMM